MSNEIDLSDLEDLIDYICRETGYSRRIVVKILLYERKYFLNQLKNLGV